MHHVGIFVWSIHDARSEKHQIPTSAPYSWTPSAYVLPLMTDQVSHPTLKLCTRVISISDSNRLLVHVDISRLHNTCVQSDLTVRHLRLSQQYSWGVHSSEIWRCLRELPDPDVSRQPTVLIFKGQHVQDEWYWTLWPAKVKTRSWLETSGTNYPVTYRRIPEERKLRHYWSVRKEKKTDG